VLDAIAELMAGCSVVAALTGAGISAESGVPTFRGNEGLWAKLRPEELASMDGFLTNPKVVWEWYNWRRELIGKVSPNPGHRALAACERLFDRFVVITQNVDGLHALAGSTHLLELHGNIYRNKCVDCNRLVASDLAIDPRQIPLCVHCGGKIRPDVVWFGEMLDEKVIDEAFSWADDAQVFLVVGTSALVHPAASLPLVAKRNGAIIVEINPDETPLTAIADFHIPMKSGECLPQLVTLIQGRRSAREIERT
jgi:NAD-dependent deacetylase